MFLFHFIVVTYIFSKSGCRDAHKIASLLNISPTLIFEMALTPFWKLTVFCWGYRGDATIKNLRKYRYNKRKRKKGKAQERGSLQCAENIWTEMKESGEFENAEVQHDSETRNA